MLLEDDVIEDTLGKSTRAGQAIKSKTIRGSSSNLKVTREDEFGKDNVTVLLDEWNNAFCKCGPVLRLSINLGSAMQDGKVLLHKGHILRKAETCMGQSTVPFDALVVVKRRKINLGHDVQSFVHRRLKFSGYNGVHSGGKGRRDKVGID
jgi:hypothetical protein